MKKLGLINFLVIGLLCASCTISTISSTVSPGVSPETPAVIQTTQPSPDHSFRKRWEMVEQPTIGDSKLSLIVYAMKVTGQGTLVISSIAGNEADKLLNSTTTTIQIRDNINIAKLQGKKNLATFGKVNFWVMQFAPHAIGASELYFLMGQDASESYYFDRLIAKFVEPPEDPSKFGITRYLISAGEVFDQEGYQISFEGWVPPPSISPTSALPGNSSVTERATLRIEDLASKQYSYLYIQFLSNGEVVGEIMK